MLIYRFKKADGWLLLLYLAYCAAVVLRVSIEGTGYTSPDSHYYLEAARSLRDGENFMVRHLYGPNGGTDIMYFAAWPIGYPTLITAASWVSGLSLFWASKLVNLFFAGLGFLLMRHVNQKYSFVLASIYGVFTVIEMYSYTWSECVFIFGCLCFALMLHKVYKTGNTNSAYVLLGIAVFMFLIRYIGFFAGGLILLLALAGWAEGRKALGKHLFITFILNAVFVCAYILHNHYMAGYNTDAQRLSEDMEPPLQVLWMAVKGLTVELFLIKKYYLKGMPDALTVMAAGLQVCVLVFILRFLQRQRRIVFYSFKENQISHSAVIVAVGYLVVLVFLRSVSQFDPLNYRLLSPFTFLMLFALVNYIVALPDAIQGVKRVKYVIAGFFVLSLLLNLPKKFLLSQLL